jgi:hypothetical protein
MDEDDGRGQADERLIAGHLRQQPQQGETDEEPVRRRPGAEAERGIEGVSLGVRQPHMAVQHRCAQLVQPGEGQLHLGLDPRGPCDPAPGRGLLEVVEERGLADPRLAAQDQHLAAAGPDPGQEPVQRLALLAPATQSRPRVTIGHDHHPARRDRRTHTSWPVSTGS